MGDYGPIPPQLEYYDKLLGQWLPVAAAVAEPAARSWTDYAWWAAKAAAGALAAGVAGAAGNEAHQRFIDNFGSSTEQRIRPPDPQTTEKLITITPSDQCGPGEICEDFQFDMAQPVGAGVVPPRSPDRSRQSSYFDWYGDPSNVFERYVSSSDYPPVSTLPPRKSRSRQSFDRRLPYLMPWKPKIVRRRGRRVIRSGFAIPKSYGRFQ